MASTPKEPRHPMACPVCKLRMDLLSRKGEYVSAGCDHCKVTMTLPAVLWDIAQIERDADAERQA